MTPATPVPHTTGGRPRPPKAAKRLMDVEPGDRFRLPAAFVAPFEGRRPAWGPVGYLTYKRCVTIDTPILTKDLRWVPSGDVAVGTEILAFEEHGRLNKDGSEGLRKYEIATVTHNTTEMADCVEITLSDGTRLQCTPDHSWLVTKASRMLVWSEAQNLLRGQTVVCSFQKYFDVWEEDRSYEGGFLSAAFDGEGSLDRQRSLTFLQVNKEMLAQVREYLHHFGFSYEMIEGKHLEGRQPCFGVRLCGQDQVVRFLGMFRPPRLMARYLELLDSRQLRQEKFRHKDDLTVVSVKPIGQKAIAVVSTSSRTHFTGGFPSHNTYARPLAEGRTEEWWQTVRRVVEGVYTVQKWHCRRSHLPWSERKAQLSAKEMFALIFDMKFLPPGRGLWAMGTEYIEKWGSTSLFNCSFHSTDHPDFARPYTFVMDFSMLGVGCGFDTRGAGKFNIRKPRTNGDIHLVEDSRDGWVRLVGRILNAYVGKAALPQEIDYSQIRAAGMPLKGFGGIAAGPAPLIRCVEHIHRILEPLIGRKITSSAIVDLMNGIGVCVVSGNVRRSAELALGDPSDEDFLRLKDPALHWDKVEGPNAWRWASNNSLLAEIGMDYTVPAQWTAKNGEPGYLWLENCRNYGRLSDPRDPKADPRVMGVNPCGEIPLESGGTCNLVETFPSRHATYEEYERTLKFAYLYSKTVTLVPLHDREANVVMRRSRRLGISQSGIAQSITRHGRRNHLNWSDRGYHHLRAIDEKYSDWLGIPRSIKLTTVKPSGSVSLLPGVTPGIHFEHAEYYYRTIRISKTSPLVSAVRRAGYRIEDELNDPSASRVVAYFPIHAEHFDRSKDQVSMWEQLELAAQMQALWADNAVSCTITFQPHEEADIPYALELYESRLKSISFLPLADHGYAQAPYITIDQAEYRAAIKGLRKLNLSEEDTHEVVDAFCDGDKCEVPTAPAADLTQAHVQVVHQFEKGAPIA